jgi:ATP-dependent exoDNAse (exonuclease V) beta subunit
VPITLRENELLLEGVADLAFEESGTWSVVDFKTDEELKTHHQRYKQQVSLYANAISMATGTPAKAFLMSL